MSADPSIQPEDPAGEIVPPMELESGADPVAADGVDQSEDGDDEDGGLA
jgi:hypothetical protein